MGTCVVVKIFKCAFLFFSIFFSHLLFALDVPLRDLNYASINLNESAQSLPIPTRIHEIIYPTIGFPSLVFKGQTFSIILQLSSEQTKILKETPPNALHMDVRLSPYFPRDVNRAVPSGYEKYYKTYFDFTEHFPTGTQYFLPFIYFPRWIPRRLQFEIKATWDTYELTDGKLILTARLPEALPEYADRALDLEVLISIGNEIIVHDIQRHCVGLLQQKEKYRMIHFSDPQINNIDIQLRGQRFDHSPDLSTQEFAFYQAIQEMNFVNPDFAIVSGDLVEGGNTYYNTGSSSAFFAGMSMILEPFDNSTQYHLENSSYWNEYQSIIQFLRRLKFPVFLAPGNHDGYAAYENQNQASTISNLKFSNTLVGPETERVLFDGKHFWQKMMGPRYFSFDFGIWHFVFLDTFEHYRFFRLSYSNFGANDGGWMSQEQIQWLETDLKAAERSGKKIILVGHHDPRGGAQGMFYQDPHYRYPRRGLLRLGDELWYKFKNYDDDPLYAAPEWASPETTVDHHNLIDTHYDSAKELLRLIQTYPVTHVFLGHVHASYHDIVKFGNRTVHFIHTTALAAQAYQARSIKDYTRSEGEEEGTPAHWGYRVFELDQVGNMSELYPLQLGNIRLNIGYDDHYRRNEGGLISPKRPMPTWVPFGSFLSTIDQHKLLPFLFKNGDPILTVHALLHPNLKADIIQMQSNPEWPKALETSFADHIDRLYVPIADEIGTPENPNECLFWNGNPFTIQGLVEFPISRDLPHMLSFQRVVTNDSDGFKLLPIGSLSTPTTTLQLEGGRWSSFPLELPKRGSFPIFLKTEKF